MDPRCMNTTTPRAFDGTRPGGDSIVRVKAKFNVSIASVARHRRTLPQGDEAQHDPKRRG